MNIGIDVDDTICDSWQIVLEHICKFSSMSYDEVVSSKKIYNQVLELNCCDYTDFSKKYSVLLNNPRLKDNVKNVIDELSRDNKIVFITRRSDKYYGDTYQFTKRYLDSNNIYYDEIVVNAYDKKKVCKDYNIDLFIDDNVNNCRLVSELGIKVLLFHNYWNDHIDDFIRVKNWNDILDIVKEELNARKVI